MPSKTVRAALMLAAIASAPALSTTSLSAAKGRPVSIEERVQGSRHVVVARARAVRPGWRVNQWGDRLIVSRVVLDVEETLKGGPGREVQMDLEGGSLDGFTMGVSSLPTLAEGERAVFFLDDAGGGVLQPHLRGQGILKLDDDDTVRESSLHLGDIRNAARQAGR